MPLKRSEVNSYGWVFIVIAVAVAFGSMGLTAITDTRSTVTVYGGRTIYEAQDDTLPPNPQKTDGNYYYVKYYWDQPKQTLPEVYAYVDKLNAEAPKCKVSFTVYKKVWGTPTHATKIGLQGIHVILYRNGDSTIYMNEVTNDKGVTVLTIECGKYDWEVITTGYEKKNAASYESWTTEGQIYYKSLVLYEEQTYDKSAPEDITTTTITAGGTTEPTETGLTQGDSPTTTTTGTGEDVGQEVIDLLNEDYPDTTQNPDDKSMDTEWKPPWEGGGQKQLTGAYDEYDKQFSMITVAVGVIGTTGLALVIFANMFMARRTR